MLAPGTGRIEKIQEFIPMKKVGFRLDAQRIIFSVLVFIAGFIFFGLLAKLTTLHFLALGAVVSTIVALYYLVTAFSWLREEE